jgi:hypothetical protein
MKASRNDTMHGGQGHQERIHRSLPLLPGRRPLPHGPLLAGEEPLLAKVAVEHCEDDEGEPHDKDQVELARGANLVAEYAAVNVLGSGS